MANCLITADTGKFDLDKAFDEQTQIFWRNQNLKLTRSKGLECNDIVFIYVIQPLSKIKYQLEVIGFAENDQYPFAQKSYWLQPDSFDTYIGNYVILKPLKKVDLESLSLDSFRENGFIGIKEFFQGTRTDRAKAIDHPIKLFFDYISQQFNLDNRAVDYPDEADTNNPRFYEGAKQSVVVNKYERSAAAREACIQKHGVNCQICAMNFEKTYGSFAKDFIHVHHIVPISQIDSNYQIDPEKDLIPVCPNCHAMLHKQVNGMDMTVETLRHFYHYSSQN